MTTQLDLSSEFGAIAVATKAMAGAAGGPPPHTLGATAHGDGGRNNDKGSMPMFKKRIRGIVAIAVLVLITAISGVISWKINVWVGVIFGIVVLGAFLYVSIRQIPADPPHKAILTVLGKRQEHILDEGLRFFPLYPYVFDAITVNVTKVNQDFPEEFVRTPDNVEVSILASITWTPNREDPKSLIQFLDSGGSEMIKTILHDIVRERLREWAFSVEEGPSTWEDAIGAGDEAVAILLKAILGEGLPRIEAVHGVPFPIPTAILLKYFSDVPQKPSKYEEKIVGSNWEKLEKDLKKLSSDERKQLKEQVDQRRDIVHRARQGNGFFKKKDLGIIINRFTINSIKPTGEIANAAEKKVKEAHERDAEELEIRHVKDMVKELMKDLGISQEQALEILQTERGKVSKNISEGKLNISPETRELISSVFASFSGKSTKEG